jgi:hypothetical protein
MDTNIISLHSLLNDRTNNNENLIFTDNNKFGILEVKVSDGRLEVILNNHESFVYDGFHMKQWGVFENYFKAGNYLQTNDANAFAKVKYYALELSH